jgi:photosystem II stability/assembly factor-like uncharacterized protein
MHKKWFLALAASLLAIPSFALRQTPFFTGGPQGGPVLRLVFSPGDPNLVLACTYYGSVYFSQDGGRNWTRTPSGDVLGSAYDAAFDLSKPSVVYAAAAAGVARSEDSGKTWTRASGGLAAARVNCVVVDSTHSGTVLAGTVFGLFRTVNSGGSWSPFGAGLPAGKAIEALSADPADPRTILVATSDGAVRRSTDGGATWGNVAGLPVSPSIVEVAFDPTTSGRAFAGASTVYQSSDHGASWIAVSDSSFLGTVSEFAFLPGEVLAATNEAIEKSTNGGVSWTVLRNGIPQGETFFNAVAVSPGSSPVILAGAEANGVLRSTDGGSTWTVAKKGLDGNVWPLAIAIDPSNPRRAVTGLSFSGGVRTTDGGGSWSWISELGIGHVYSAIAVPAVAGRFVAGTHGAYFSTDGGASWHASSSQIADNVYSLAAGTSAAHPLFAGTASSGVWKSTDSGGSWQASSAGLPAAGVLALTVGPAPESVVYAGLADGSVWRSTDSGGSWHPTGAPDSSSVNCLAADPNHASVVYAGTGKALYKSSDGGSSWTSLNAALGISVNSVYGIALPAQAPGTVFVAILGNGALASHDDGATWNPIDRSFVNVSFSYAATAIATDPTGQWIYEGSLATGIFQIAPLRIDPAEIPTPKKVNGENR